MESRVHGARTMMVLATVTVLNSDTRDGSGSCGCGTDDVLWFLFLRFLLVLVPCQETSYHNLIREEEKRRKETMSYS